MYHYNPPPCTHAFDIPQGASKVSSETRREVQGNLDHRGIEQCVVGGEVSFVRAAPDLESTQRVHALPSDEGRQKQVGWQPRP